MPTFTDHPVLSAMQRYVLGMEISPMDKRTRGTGSVFQRTRRGITGPNFFIGYYDRNGRQIQESSGSPIKAVAERKLRQKLADVEKGVPVEQARRLKYEDIRQ